MKYVRIVIVLLVGLISAPLVDLLSVAWMSNAPLALDLTGSYFVSVAVPIVLLVHLLAAVVLWKLFEPRPVLNCSLYTATHALAQVAMWQAFGNPVADIITIVIIILLSGTLVFGVFHRYFWCAACTQIE